MNIACAPNTRPANKENTRNQIAITGTVSALRTSQPPVNIDAHSVGSA